MALKIHNKLNIVGAIKISPRPAPLPPAITDPYWSNVSLYLAGDGGSSVDGDSKNQIL